MGFRNFDLVAVVCFVLVLFHCFAAWFSVDDAVYKELRQDEGRAWLGVGEHLGASIEHVEACFGHLGACFGHLGAWP